MTDADLEEQNYRRQVGEIIDAFLVGKVTTTMATVSLRALFPIFDAHFDENCMTTLRMMLDDLAETAAFRGAMLKDVVNMIIDGQHHYAHMRALDAAITSLAAQGHVVIQVAPCGHFLIDGNDHYTVDDIIDLASRV